MAENHLLSHSSSSSPPEMVSSALVNATSSSSSSSSTTPSSTTPGQPDTSVHPIILGDETTRTISASENQGPNPVSLKSAFDAIVKMMVKHQRTTVAVDNVIEPILLCMFDYEIEMELRENLQSHSIKEGSQQNSGQTFIAMLEAVGEDHNIVKRKKRDDILSLLSQGNVDYRKWAYQARFEQLAQSNVGRIRPSESSTTIFCVGDIDWESEIKDAEISGNAENNFYRYIQEIATAEDPWKTRVAQSNKTVDLAFNLGEDGTRKFVGSEAFAKSLKDIQKFFDALAFDVGMDWPPASFDNHLMEYMKLFKLKGSPLKRYLVKEDSVLPPRFLTFIKGQIVKLSKNRPGCGGILNYSKLPKKFIDNYDKLIELKPDILLLPDPSFLRLVYFPRGYWKRDLNTLFNVSCSPDAETKHMDSDVEGSTYAFKPKEYGLMFTTAFIHPFSGFVMSAEEAIPEKRRVSLWTKLGNLKDVALRNLATQEWSKIWQQLEELGWTKKQSDTNFPVYKPGFRADDINIPGETTFNNEQDVRQHLFSGLLRYKLIY